MTQRLKTSYVQKLVTALSGGILMLLDPVLELNPLNDLGYVTPQEAEETFYENINAFDKVA